MRILATTTVHLARQVGALVPVTVSDASPEPLAPRVRAVWQRTGADVEISDVRGSLPASLDELLSRMDEPWFALQFDDMLTAGLSPELLQAACRLLDRYAHALHVVCPFWPLQVSVDPSAQRIVAESHEERNRRGATEYRFLSTGWLRPVVVEKVDGLRFGIFENFTYGFFFNHLIAPVDDFRTRLAWYRRHVDPDDAHAIELAAAPKLRGPWWTHLAVPLDGCTLVDLDYSHTQAAVRAQQPELREVHDAVQKGWPIEVPVRRFGSAAGGEPEGDTAPDRKERRDDDT